MTYRGDKSPGGSIYISAASLLLEFRHFVDSHPTLAKINQANPVWPTLTQYCEQLEQYPVIMRSLTLLHVNSQIDFERALFCSWGSLLVARALKLSESHRRTLFYAGLFQDFGKHAIELDLEGLVGKYLQPAISINQTRTSDVHPLISSTYLEDVFPDVTGLSELVLYHHAKDDGTGYPYHISESQLAIDHQILIIANEISDRLDRLGGHNHLADCLPGLKVGSMLYFKSAHSGWFDLVSPYLEQDEQLTDLARACLVLQAKRDCLEKLISNLLCVSGELLRFDFDLQVHGFRSMIRKLACLMTDAGLFHHQALSDSTIVSTQELKEISLILKGVPDVLKRCVVFVENIVSSNFDVCPSLMEESRQLLQLTIRELEGRTCRIFR
jgi:hypothetical protein